MKLFSFILLVTLTSSVLADDVRYGLKDAQIARMSIDQWLDHCHKVKGEALPEYEIRGALGQFSESVQGRIKGLLGGHPKAKQDEFAKLQKSLEDMVFSLHEVEFTASMGGSMYLTFHAFRFAESKVLVRDLLERKLKNPGNRLVSDGNKALDRLYKRVSMADIDFPGSNAIEKVNSAFDRSKAHYKAVTQSLKNRSRADSNAVLEFCIQAIDGTYSDSS